MISARHQAVAAALEQMSSSIGMGTPLVPSIEAARDAASDPELRTALQEALDSWFKDRDILPPFEKRTELFPRVVYWATAVGFEAGFLESSWPFAAKVIRSALGAPPADKAAQTRRDVYLFFLEWAGLVRLGIRLATALSAAAEDVGGAARALGSAMQVSAEKNESLVPVLTAQSLIVPAAFIDAVRLGEEHNDLDDRLAKALEEWRDE